MPFVKATYVASLKAALVAAHGQAETQQDQDVADAFGDALETAISQFTVAAAIPVQVVPATGTGATTGPGTVS